MNTQVGKSIGIALLLAAGLLAALFAMGVFAPAGVEADVKGKPAPEYELSTHKPGATGVTLKVTFEVNDDVDGAPNDDQVKIKLTEFSKLSKDNIKVEQGGKPVGYVSIGKAGEDKDVILIGFHADNPTLLEDVLTTVTITGLTNGASGETGTIAVYQSEEAPKDVKGKGYLEVAFTPSVTSASVELSDYDAGDPVEMTLTFEADTASTETQNNVVTIVIPEEYYDLDEKDTKGNSVVKVKGVGGTASIAPGKNEITVHTFIKNNEVEVTITGLTNPDTSETVIVKFSQGKQTAIERTVYVTKLGDTTLNVVLDDYIAGAEGVEMSFEFEPLVTVGKDDPHITIQLDEGFVFEGTTLGGVTKDIIVWQEDGNDVVIVDGSYNTKGGLTITLFDDGDEPVDMGRGPVFVVIKELTNPDDAGDLQDAVTITQGGFAPASATVRLTGVTLSSESPGARVRIEISERATNKVPLGDDIVVTLGGFDLPEEIRESQVLIDGTDTGYQGNPSSVTIDGSRITLSMPTKAELTDYPNSSAVPENTTYTITFKNGANIRNPETAGSKSITIGDADDEPTKLTRTIATSVTLSPAAISRGGTLAITGRGFASDFFATAYLVKGDCFDPAPDCDEDENEDNDGDPITDDDDFRLGGDLVDGGRVNVSVRVTSSEFQANANGEGPLDDAGNGTNRIAIVDGTGGVSTNDAGDSGFTLLTIIPTVVPGTESIKQGGLLELEVEDWHYGNIYSIHVGGVPVTHRWTEGQRVELKLAGSIKHIIGIDGSGEDDFIIVMPPGVRLDEQELKLTGTTFEEQGSDTARDVFKGEIFVDPLDLEIEPTNAEGMPEVVVNQEFTIEGRGFTTMEGACIESVKVGDISIPETTAGVEVDCGSDSVRPDTAGNFSATFKLEPRFGASRLKVGEYRVEVRDNEGRVGRVDMIIPEPVVEVTPDESRRGSTVTVIGSKYPASSELAVEIKYGLAGNERTIGAATPDSAGNWRTTLVVPTTAIIGEDHVVLAAPINEDYDHFKGKGAHRLPEQEVIVKPARVAAGGRMTIEGHNMPLFTLVKLKISNINIHDRDVETDGIGSFVVPNVLVPQLQPGIHTVEALVATQGEREPVSVRTTVQVADIVTRPTDEVFEDLITAGQLTVVWRYDNATSTWASYDPAAPDELNDLMLVSTNEIVWVEVTETVEFQGGQLYVGWNLITLE